MFKHKTHVVDDVERVRSRHRRKKCLAAQKKLCVLSTNTKLASQL